MSFHFATGWRCMGACSVSYPEKPDGELCVVCGGCLMRARILGCAGDMEPAPDRRDERRRVLRSAGL